MITPREIAKATMTEEKREQARTDYFAFYIGRPLTYVFTVPFLYTNIRPDTISKISMIPTIIGFIIFCFARTKLGLLIGCLCFFMQSMLDGVDGNVARYRKQFSKYGSVWDAMSGYLLGCLSFLGVGVAASHVDGIMGGVFSIPSEIYIVLGALTGMAIIFPRLIMHKAITTAGKTEAIDSVKNKGKFNIIKILALNLASSASGQEILRPLCVVLGCLDIFIVFYFLFFIAMAVASIHVILKE